MTTITDEHRKAAPLSKKEIDDIAVVHAAMPPNTVVRQLLATITHLLAEREEMARGQWRPIAEAPRNGSDQITACFRKTVKRPTIVNSRWNGERWDAWEKNGEHTPTHFMPRPALPEPTTTDAGGDG